MKRLPFFAGLLLVVTASLHAQESLDSELDFVRKLRAKGYLDLAKEKLGQLRAIPDAGLQALIPLESARIAIATARMREPDQRPGLFLSARKDLEAFVAKNAGRPEAAQARLEIARLAALNGEALLTRTMREDEPKLKYDQARKAEAQFLQASQELDAAAKQLTALAAGYKNPDADVEKRIKEQLQQDAYQARFDRANNIINQARTYYDDGKSESRSKRADLMKEAIKSLEAVLEADTPTAVRRLAEAWLIRCNHEIQDPQAAARNYNKVINDETPAAVPAQRLASLFKIQGIFLHIKGELVDNDLKKKKTPELLKEIEKEAQGWLRYYPSHAQTPEGWAVQFELANVFYFQGQLAMGLDKAKKPTVMTKAAAKLFADALKLYTLVADSDSEYAEEAGGVALKLSVDRIKDLDLAQINNFEDCFLKARYEMMLVREINKDNDPKNSPKLKAQLRNLIAAVQRAQNLADAKTPPAKLDETRFMMTASFLISGDVYRAAVAGEALGRTRPPGKRSPVGAAYAIEAYAAIYDKDKEEGNRQRLQSLADFVLAPESQKTWSTDPVTSVAHYHLAMVHNKDDKFKEALAHLERLPPDFFAYLYATGQAVFIALDGRDKAKDPQEKAFFTEQARKALARLPALANDADSTTAAMFFQAQLEHTKFLYMDAAKELEQNEPLKALAKYQDMLKFLDQLAAGLGKHKLTPETKGKFDYSIEVIRKFARYGQADVDYRFGRYDKVLEQAGEVLKAVEAKAGAGAEPIRFKDVDITSQILGLALRAKVQKGQIPDAKKILNWMDRLKGTEEGIDVDTSNTLRALIQELKGQVEELKKAKDEDKLKQTVANFSSFADELANKPKLETRDYIFLANFYNSLGQFKKAAELYSKVPQPPALGFKELPKDAKEREPVEKAINNYWYLQIEYAKALRLGKKDKSDLQLANKILETLLRHPHARFSLYAVKEKIHILEDLELYGQAIKKWGEFMNNPALKKELPNDNNLKKLYFEAYYHNTWCWFKLSQADNAIKAGKEKQYLEAAARYIIRLETAENQEGWQMVGEKFRRLLDAEKKLHEAYEHLKKTMK